MPSKDKDQPKVNPFEVEATEPETISVDDQVVEETGSEGRTVADDRDEVARLREENDRLRAQIAEGDAKLRAAKPQQPSFGISEGTRNDLEMHGKATDPFTGKALTRDDLPENR